MTARQLFLRSRHRLRSPTATAVFGNRPGLEVDSAGPAADAEITLDAAQLDQAMAMEARHVRRLRRRYGRPRTGKRVVSVDIPERYAFMQPELIARLERRVAPLLR